MEKFMRVMKTAVCSLVPCRPLAATRLKGKDWEMGDQYGKA